MTLPNGDEILELQNREVGVKGLALFAGGVRSDQYRCHGRYFW